MAITRAQQAKQMLQDGGMLVQPGFGGKRQGYKGGADMSGRDVDVSATGDVSAGPSGSGSGDGRDPTKQFTTTRTPNIVDEVALVTGNRLTNVRNVDRMRRGLRNVISPSTQTGNRALRTILNITTPGLGEVFARTIDKAQPDIFGTKTDDDDDDIDRGEGGIFNTVAQQRPMMSSPQTTAPVTSAPAVDLNRVAYRLMADGGAVIDDEPRQAYGLGSIVKKATRAVKKVAKSDIGKAAIAAAGVYYLGGGAAFGGPGFSFGNLPGAGFFKGKSALNTSLLQNLPSTVSDRLATQAAKTAMGTGSKSIFGGLGTKAGLGIAALSALPLLGVGVEEDEEQEEFSPYLGEGLDIAAIRANPRKFQGQAYRLMSSGGDTEDAKTEKEDLSNDPNYKGWVKLYKANPDAAMMNEKANEYLQFYNKKAKGGDAEPVAKKVMPLIDMNGKEKDYRETGGFVDIGRMEKADDVPARLSKNEFVFTADAVRNAGDGSVDKGAEVMYNMMKNLEAGGEVSEESQGLEGARKMFQTSQRLEEVL